MVDIQSEMPFHETAEDASFIAISNSHKAMKEVAHALWPALKIDTAYARLVDGLKHDRPVKITTDEHIHIANLTGHYDYLRYIAASCHHSQPVPIEPEDEKAALQREFIQYAKQMKQISARIEGLNS